MVPVLRLRFQTANRNRNTGTFSLRHLFLPYRGLPPLLPLTLPKLAVTPMFEPTVTVHVSCVPLHAPPQPRNEVRLPGFAVSITVVDTLFA